MPRQVDVGRRRKEIYEAVFRLLVRGGVEQASLRKVADEAGLNIGAVRNYFDNHEELMTAAAREILDRISARLYADLAELEAGADPAEAARKMLCELLPLDETRRYETTVMFTLAERGRFTPAYAELSAEIHDGTRRLIHEILTRAGIADVEVETERLASLIDGLGFNGITHRPPPTPAFQLEVLDFHLDQLRRTNPDRRRH
ncbi:TetR/AcrR family transcriptional regulator [Microlunatus soli]|uniref:Regulatory protein, tetR family n=1 Tax=Microlunatus soli TaxID=630515 RepID=A0A1H1VPV6_9ACTN|nr:TetR family transcriptional regulator C-terminal domain-containing protein [Microlunatus soli]SDS86772.1 regulatory protein, tetR family [Microlunatus soli]